MLGSLSSYKDVMRKAYNHLKPGGYFECHELDPKPECDDGTLPAENLEGFSDYALRDWVDLCIRSGQISDPPKQFRIAHRVARWMKDVGFFDVKERINKVPCNPWPNDERMKQIGRWSQTNLLEAVGGWSYKPFLTLGWSKPEIEVFLVSVRRSIQNRDVHAYMNYHTVTGRKPFPDEQPQA